MIKAVFFDLYHTLVRYEPPQEVLEAEALKEFGVDVKPADLSWPLVAADEFIYGELARIPLSKRAEKDKLALYAQYQKVVLKEAGIEAREGLVLGLLGKMRDARMKLVLFDDVLPALNALKQKGLILGLISNIDHDISPALDELGLPALLRIIVTSQEAGTTKPNPGIFREALRRAGVQPAEAVYVGDQYQVDVAGARNAGMKGVLLDRGDFFAGINDCPRIQSLAQIDEHL